MLPIIADEIAVERASIYNRGMLAQHPLNGVTVKNTTGKLLLQGPVTVFDANTYGGDARIDNVPPDQEQLFSYAIDLQVRVEASDQRQESSVRIGKLMKGVCCSSRGRTP
jgi:hypothetical protein